MTSNKLLEAIRGKQTQSSQAASTSIGRNIDSQQAAWDQSLKEQPSTFKTWNPDVDTPKTNPLLSFTPEWQEQQAAKKAEKEKPKKKGLFGITIPDGSENVWDYDATNNIIDTSVPATPKKEEPKKVEPPKEEKKKEEPENPFYTDLMRTIDDAAKENTADYGLGNIDLNSRPTLQNPDGSISTVDSTTWEEDGKYIVMPTVINENGEWKHVSPEEALDHYHKTGEYLGKFDTKEESDTYAQQLHEDQERLYGDNPFDWSGLLGRTWNTIKGSGKQIGSSFTNALGTYLDFMGENGFASNLAAGTLRSNAVANPFFINDPAYQQFITDAEQYGDAATKQAAADVQKIADDLGGSAQADLNAAKDGLGKFGQAAVDIGSNVIQMGSDALIGMLTGGSSLFPMAVRVFGQSSQEARQEGATTNQQVGYGLTSAAIETLTEKMADGLAGIYGKGAADDVAEEAIRKLAKTDTGRTILRFMYGANSEGFEEVVSDILSPYAKMIYNNKTLEETFGEGYDPSELLYDYLIGAALGGLGGTVNIAKGGNAEANAALATTDAVENMLVESGMDAYTAEQVAPTVEKAMNGEELTQKEKNILMEIRNREDVAAGSNEVATPAAEEVNTETATAPVEAPEDVPEKAQNKKARLETELDTAQENQVTAEAETPAPVENPGEPVNKKARLETELDTAQENQTAPVTATSAAQTTPANRGVNPNKAAQIQTELDKRSERIAEIQQEIADLEQQIPSAERNEAILRLVEEQNDLTQENATEAQQEEAERTAEEETTEEQQNTPTEETTEEESTAQEPTAEQTSENQQGQDTDTVEEEYNALGEKYGTIEEGENPAREISVPKKTTDDTKVSESVRTVAEAEATPESRLPDIKSAVVEGRVNFTPTTNADIADAARAKVEKMGWQKAVTEWTAAVRSGQANADLVAEGAVLLNNAANNKECSGAEYIDIMLDYVKLNRTLGKGLAAARILKTLSPEGKLYALQKIVSNMNEARAEQATKKGKSEAEQLAEKYSIDPALIEEYRQQTTDEGRDAVLEKMQQNIADQIPATLKDKFTALRYLNMLGNLKTQARNVVGNLGNMLVYKAKNTIRSAMESVAQQMSDGKYEKQYSAFYGTELKSVANQYYNTHPDVQKETMGERKYANVAQEFESGIEEKRTIFKSKALQKYSQLTNWMMEAGDQIFCQATFTDALAGYLKAHNITAEEWTNLVNEADANPTSEAAEKVDKATQFAIKQAQEATFRDTNAVSKALSTFDSNWSKFGKTLSQGIIPFRKTPANVLVRMEEFSPLGFINTAVKAAQAKKGVNNVTQQDVIDSLAKSVTGAGLAAIGFILAAAGRARTKSDDEKQEAYDKLKGLQDYSITVGGKNYTADWLTPESASLFMGVELYNLMQDGTITVEDGIKIIGNLTSPMLEMSMLSGVNDALSNIASFNEDTDALPQFVLNSAWGYLSQGLTNTLLGQLEQANEEYRQTYYTDSENPLLTTSMQKMLAKAGNKTPGIDYQAADYIDAWGRKQENGDNILSRYFNALVNPSYVSNMDKKATAVDDELQRLYDYGKDIDGFPNVLPQQVKRTQTVNKTKLSPEEYDKYATTKGQKSLELVSDLIESSAYKKLNDDEKAEAISEMYSYAKYLADSQIAKDRKESFKPSTKRYENMEKAEKAGIDPTEFYGYYQKYKDIDNSQGSAQKHAEQFAVYIDKQNGLTTTQKNILKDSFKFSGGFTATTDTYDKWRAAGLSPEDAQGFRDKIDAFGNSNGNISNAEVFAAIEQYAKDADMAERLWKAAGTSTSKKKTYQQANSSTKFKGGYVSSGSSSSSGSTGNRLLDAISGTSGSSSTSSSTGNRLLDALGKG